MRRRRRRGRKRGSNSTDAFELFLDALCNALGVIMFILLCVVIFSKPPTSEQVEIDPSVMIEETKTLEAQLAPLERKMSSLLQALAALPPSGDPAIIKRWQEVLAELKEMRSKKLAEVDAEAKARARLAAASKSVTEAEERQRNIGEELARLDDVRKESNTVVQFVRISRFKSDPRKPVLLLCAGGRVTTVKVESKGQEISEPKATGIPVTDSASARLALGQLLAGKDPAAWRVEVAVWPSGFRAYKILEREMIEQKFGINPLPVPEGEPILEGAGGIQ